MKSNALTYANLLRLDWVQLGQQSYTKTIAFFHLCSRLLRYGYRPHVRQACDRTNQCYWYAYYPLTGVSKFLTSDTEIQEWVNRMQDI